jgi:hypothetical protein
MDTIPHYAIYLGLDAQGSTNGSGLEICHADVGSNAQLICCLDAREPHYLVQDARNPPTMSNVWTPRILRPALKQRNK